MQSDILKQLLNQKRDEALKTAQTPIQEKKEEQHGDK